MSGRSNHNSTNKNNRIIYFYDSEVGNYNYGPGHPMKPHRIRMAHSLIVNYGIDKYLQVLKPPRATIEDISRFHSDDYVLFLQRVTPETVNEIGRNLHKYNVGDDCPVFEGLFEYCQIQAGGSIGAAVKMNHGQADIAINWAGGLHHAKRGEASGFCYVNDIVLAILELLKYHFRVLYIDIDVHHGDGVEEAFYTTDRVMTVSFHKYGEFFPGTGDIHDVGYGRGKYYSVNVPLRDGIDDATYQSIFEPIIGNVIEWYRPGAIVMQCGADSLSGDRLGCFNLSHIGHSKCIEFVKKFGLPLMLLGGGGYTIRNVARCWAFETAQVVNFDPETVETFNSNSNGDRRRGKNQKNQYNHNSSSSASFSSSSSHSSPSSASSSLFNFSISEELPFNDYFEYYGPDYTINVPPSNMPNQNSPEFINKCREIIIENLRHVQFAPNAQIQSVPPDLFREDPSEEDEEDSQEDDQRERMIKGKIKRGNHSHHHSHSNSHSHSNGKKDNSFKSEWKGFFDSSLEKLDPLLKKKSYKLSRDQSIMTYKDLTAEFENLENLSQ